MSTWGSRAAAVSGDDTVLRPASGPFSPDGGLILVKGNLGRAVMKTSAVKPEHRTVEAPALVFDDQDDLLAVLREPSADPDRAADKADKKDGDK